MYNLIINICCFGDYKENYKGGEQYGRQLEDLTLLMSDEGVWGFEDEKEYEKRRFMCVASQYTAIEDLMKNNAVMERNKLKLSSCNSKEKEEYQTKLIDLLERTLKHLYRIQKHYLVHVYKKELVNKHLDKIKEKYNIKND